MQANLIVFNNLVLDGESLTSAITTTPQDISNVRGFCVQGKYSITSASAESFTIEASTNPDDSDLWTAISTFNLSSSGTFLLNVELPNYTHIRAIYTPVATSDGTLSMRMTGKI